MGALLRLSVTIDRDIRKPRLKKQIRELQLHRAATAETQSQSTLMVFGDI